MSRDIPQGTSIESRINRVDYNVDGISENRTALGEPKNEWLVVCELPTYALARIGVRTAMEMVLKLPAKGNRHGGPFIHIPARGPHGDGHLTRAATVYYEKHARM